MSAPAISSFEVFSRLAESSELPEWQDLATAIVRRRLQPGEPLFLTGQAQPRVFVVTAGVITMVYETPSGDSWIKGFAEAGIAFASLTSLETGGLTSYSAYAETDAVVEQIDFGAIQRLAERHGGWQRALSNAFKLYGQRKERREMELLTLSPEERYLGFLRGHPHLAGLLRQRDIASYIRITPVALSRIKARLKRAGKLT
jgi:CRP-like cAMP-binding protein